MMMVLVVMRKKMKTVMATVLLMLTALVNAVAVQKLMNVGYVMVMAAVAVKIHM